MYIVAKIHFILKYDEMLESKELLVVSNKARPSHCVLPAGAS